MLRVRNQGEIKSEREDELKKHVDLSCCVDEEETERKGRPRKERERERELFAGNHGSSASRPRETSTWGEDWWQ